MSLLYPWKTSKTSFSLWVAALFLSAVLRAQAQEPDSFTQGLIDFQKKQYDQAIDSFGQALRAKPGDPMTYYYLGYSHYAKGNKKEAALYFLLSDVYRPSPDIRAFGEGVKAKLSPEDQKWVEDQMASAPGYRHRKTQDPQKISFGVRASTGTAFPNFGDFNDQQDAWTTMEGKYQLSDPRLGLTISNPWAEPYFGLDPFLAWKDFEVGVKLTYYLPSSTALTMSDPYGYSNGYTGDMDGFTVANVDRFYVTTGNDSRFYLEPILGLHVLHFRFKIAYQNSSGSPSNASYGFDVNGTGLDAGLKAGFSFRTSDGVDISFGGGYEFDQIRNMRGTFIDPTFSNRNGLSGQAVMNHDTYWNRDFIWFMPDDQSKVNLFYGGSSQPGNNRPLVVDFSGIHLDLDVSFIF